MVIPALLTVIPAKAGIQTMVIPAKAGIQVRSGQHGFPLARE